MVESRAGKQVQDLETLLPKLGGLPLALVQAGSYLAATGITVSEYVSYYDETWADLMRYQEQFPLQEYAERSVLTTWKMSYEQVRSTNALAARLLDLWAFLFRGDLWIELVLAGKDTVTQQDLREADPLLQATKLTLQHSVSILVQYSMVTMGTGSVRHSIHPVVHAWCAYNIETTTAEQQLLSTALRLVAAMAETLPEVGSPETGLRLAAHAKALGGRAEMLIEDDDEDISTECYDVALFLARWERSGEVEMLYLRALRGFEKALGAEHTSTLETFNNLGILYADQEKLVEAEEMFLRALRGKEKAYGAEHTSTLVTVNNLGTLYREQGKIVEAEEIYLRALRGYEKAYGAEHTSMLATVHNLGTLYREQGKIVEAEEMYLRALRGYEKAYGAEHTSILNTVNNLGVLYFHQGRIDEAEEMFLRALRGYEKAWGTEQEQSKQERTSTREVVFNLGVFYEDQGRIVEAKEMFSRALLGYRALQNPPQAQIDFLERKLASMQKAEEYSVARLDPEISTINPTLPQCPRSPSPHSDLLEKSAQRKRRRSS
ncbi:tetratricopeptide repeat domain [Lecanosticta acicola]|uniref:Tetratricopeptide repeat domain n=1 Tax=Lecanosticta acicola TaxID=111012 RepID=A0AAI9EA27_9PEZI|nr:tetratricopeptide repeat domain [Lecanosticta acicola]